VPQGGGVAAGPLVAYSLSSGAYEGAMSALPGGTYALTAQYGGDGTYAGSTSAPVQVTVTPEASTATGTTWAPSTFYVMGKRPIIKRTAAPLQDPFFLQVQIASASGQGAATGSIALSDGTKTFGSYPLDRNGSILRAMRLGDGMRTIRRELTRSPPRTRVTPAFFRVRRPCRSRSKKGRPTIRSV